MSEQLLRAQDEILQMMYWMRGEQLGDSMSPEQINRFLRVSPDELGEAIDRLIIRGLLERGGEALQLTERGVDEGKRRFLDEFSSYLGKDSHLACSDPNCDCSREGFDGVCISVAAKNRSPD